MAITNVAVYPLLAITHVAYLADYQNWQLLMLPYFFLNGTPGLSYFSGFKYVE